MVDTFTLSSDKRNADNKKNGLLSNTGAEYGNIRASKAKDQRSDLMLQETLVYRPDNFGCFNLMFRNTYIQLGR